MSVGAVLGGIAVEVAREALEWAVDKVKTRAKEKLGKVVSEALDPKIIEALLMVELQLLAKTMEGMVASIDADAKKLEESEAAFRASSNVEVIE